MFKHSSSRPYVFVSKVLEVKPIHINFFGLLFKLETVCPKEKPVIDHCSINTIQDYKYLDLAKPRPISPSD